MENLTINNVWMMICTALVFFMHLGFAFLEIGLTRQKNTINVLFKNIFILTSGLLLYYLIGFNLMYPEEFNGYIATLKIGITPPENGMQPNYANAGYTWWTDFLFQGMFAATAATIVSGAVAERIKIGPFMVFTVIYVGFVYPIIGSWKWGKGFLDELGFYDFAGSTLVHSVGGWAALIAIIILGPRIGKFKKKKSLAIPGHNIPIATAGVFILWFGWFGFNGGSVLSANPEATSLTLVNTCLSAAAGAISAGLISFIYYKNLDITMLLNGILGGLVGVTASADIINPESAIIIGVVSGTLVVISVRIMDLLRLDDPVGAIPVHLVCGIWGTLAVGIFSKNTNHTFLTQFIGVMIYAVTCMLISFLIFYTLKRTFGIRVHQQEEIEGLDAHEHKMDAYPDFRLNEH
jgi:Amt family ammonium transporter